MLADLSAALAREAEVNKLLRSSVFALVALLCAGCIDVTTLVTVRKDGSGTIEETVYMSKAFEQMLNEMAASMGGKKESTAKPFKIDEEKLKAKAARMGEGVRFVSAKEVKKADGANGLREVYAFDDVRKLRLQSDPDTSSMKGAEKPAAGPGGGAKAKKPSPPVTFGFTPGDPAALTIRLPESRHEAPAGSSGPKPGPDKPAPNGPAPSKEEMAMAKQMFEGFRFRMMVGVDGEITQTNASFPHAGPDGKKRYVTLFDMNIGELIKDENMFKMLLARGEMQDMSTARKKLLDVPGLKIETEREITVRFK